MDIEELSKKIKSIDEYSRKKNLFEWTFKYIRNFNDLELSKETVNDIENYVFSYKSNQIFIFSFGKSLGWSFPYYDKLMQGFTGFTKVLNNMALHGYGSEFSMCNYNNLYWYFKDLIKASLVNLDYPELKA